MTSALRKFDPDIGAAGAAGEAELFSRRKRLLAKSIKALEAPWAAHGVVQPLPNLERFREMVAVRAYYKAERRGFEPGCEVEDWLEAESELLPAPSYLFD
jgi:hypothetical protein